MTISDSEQVPDRLHAALELNAENITRFNTFTRIGNFWIFGDDQADGVFGSDRKVTVLAHDHIITFTATQLEDFGKYVWICDDGAQETTNETDLESDTGSVLIAIYSGHSWRTSGQVFVGTPTAGKVEFYRIKPVSTA